MIRGIILPAAAIGAVLLGSGASLQGQGDPLPSWNDTAHDDSDRERAYDRKSQIGKLDKAWDEAVAKGSTILSMKDDWKTIFPATAR
jgi:hypothetical protein